MVRLIHYIFYGNLFYGLCAVALIWETSVQLDLQIRDPLLYLTSFAGTVLFYNYPYLHHFPSAPTPAAADPRVRWIRQNRSLFYFNQTLLVLGLLSGLTGLLIKYRDFISQVSIWQCILFLSVPLIAASYYKGMLLRRHRTLRQVGWLKPFVIGLVWTGLVFLYPILFSSLIRPGSISIHFFMILLFVKSVMYISLLAILFDAKDVVSDRTHQVRTLVVKMGLRQTLFYLVLPMTILGLLTIFTYAVIQSMTGWRILVTLIPFILLILSIFSLRKERSLLYYLVVIDGLMLIKALCGIVATQL